MVKILYSSWLPTINCSSHSLFDIFITNGLSTLISTPCFIPVSTSWSSIYSRVFSSFTSSTRSSIYLIVSVTRFRSPPFLSVVLWLTTTHWAWCVICSIHDACLFLPSQHWPLHGSSKLSLSVLDSSSGLFFCPSSQWWVFEYIHELFLHWYFSNQVLL